MKFRTWINFKIKITEFIAEVSKKSDETSEGKCQNTNTTGWTLGFFKYFIRNIWHICLYFIWQKRRERFQSLFVAFFRFFVSIWERPEKVWRFLSILFSLEDYSRWSCRHGIVVYPLLSFHEKTSKKKIQIWRRFSFRISTEDFIWNEKIASLCTTSSISIVLLLTKFW